MHTQALQSWLIHCSSVTFHINGYHSDRSAPCLYTVTGWGVTSCVCSMAFLCGSTLVKVPLLQAGTVAIWPQMFKSYVKPKTKQKIDAGVMDSSPDAPGAFTVLLMTGLFCTPSLLPSCGRSSCLKSCFLEASFLFGGLPSSSLY